MGAQTGHLVGRAEELGSLDRVRAELDRGRSVAVLLVGEAGIGKTRLLTEFGARADAEGDLVLSGVKDLSWSAISRSRSSSTRSTSTCEESIRSSSRRSRTTSGRSSLTSSRR